MPKFRKQFQQTLSKLCAQLITHMQATNAFMHPQCRQNTDWHQQVLICSSGNARALLPFPVGSLMYKGKPQTAFATTALSV